MKKSNTIALILPSGKVDFKIPPFSLLFLSYGLKKEGYNVNLYHIQDEEIDSAVDEIIKTKPMFAGFSVITGLPTYYASEMSEQIKKKSDIPVVWGGIHTSLLYKQCLNEKYIDFVVIGEGEETIVELADAIKKDKDYSHIKGIGYKLNQEPFINRPRSLKRDISDYKMDIDAINWSDYIHESDTMYNGKIVRTRELGYYSSRGCRHNCSF